MREYSSLFVGRSADCDFRVEDPKCVVSRTHALIEWDDASPPNLTLTDLHSANGTFLNGERVEGTVPVANADAIQLGVKVGPIFRIAVVRPAGEEDKEPPPPEERRSAWPAPRDPDREEERARSPASGTRPIIRGE